MAETCIVPVCCLDRGSIQLSYTSSNRRWGQKMQAFSPCAAAMQSRLNKGGLLMLIKYVSTSMMPLLQPVLCNSYSTMVKAYAAWQMNKVIAQVHGLQHRWGINQ